MAKRKKMAKLELVARRIAAVLRVECDYKQKDPESPLNADDAAIRATTNDLHVARMLEVDYLVIPLYSPKTDLVIREMKFSTFDGSLVNEKHISPGNEARGDSSSNEAGSDSDG